MSFHTSRRDALRRLALVCACVSFAACSGGDGGTGPGAFKMSMKVPGTVTGAWSPNASAASAVLLCRPDLSLAATGQGRATWTGGSATFTAPYGTYPFTYSAAEVAQIVGVDGIEAGQSLVVPVPKGGWASFRYSLTVNYSVEGTGHLGSATATFDCEAP